jgi:hypothetical protein
MRNMFFSQGVARFHSEPEHKKDNFSEIVPFITALLGVVRKEAFDSRLDDCTRPLVLKPTADPFRQLNREFGHQSYSALS